MKFYSVVNQNVEESFCRDGSSWCEESDSYPYELVKSLMNATHPLWPSLMNQQKNESKVKSMHHRSRRSTQQ